MELKNEEIVSMTRINANLQQAYTTFVSTLAKHRTDPSVLKEIYQEKLERLDQSMDMLTKLARAGMEEQLSPLLSTLLQEWAIKEAIELFLRYPGCAFNLADQNLQQSFWSKLERQHQTLSSELLLHLQQAKMARAQALEERSRSWQSVAYKSLEDQRTQQNQWQNTAFQWVQGQQQMNQQWFDREQTMFNQYQQANQKWADTALLGVQQAQVGTKQYQDFAASIHNDVSTILGGSTQAVAQGVYKGKMRAWGTKLFIVMVVIVGFVALSGVAFFAMMHLF
jgi:hypothetical protein